MLAAIKNDEGEIQNEGGERTALDSGDDDEDEWEQ